MKQAPLTTCYSRIKKLSINAFCYFLRTVFNFYWPPSLSDVWRVSVVTWHLPAPIRKYIGVGWKQFEHPSTTVCLVWTTFLIWYLTIIVTRLSVYFKEDSCCWWDKNLSPLAQSTAPCQIIHARYLLLFLHTWNATLSLTYGLTS